MAVGLHAHQSALWPVGIGPQAYFNVLHHAGLPVGLTQPPSALQGRKERIVVPAQHREFQKIVRNQGVDPTSPDYPLAHIGLARAYALQGDQAGSRREYEEFFALWKDADQDIPILREARSAYAGLMQRSR